MRAGQFEARASVCGLPDSLTCPRCGFTSHNPSDVHQQYCGVCHLFVQDAAVQKVMAMLPGEHALCFRLALTYARPLRDGRWLVVLPVPAGALLRFCYDGDPHPPSGEDAMWIYENLAFAVIAAATWDPSKEREPYGWTRHASSGRSRPHGDRRMEYVRTS